MNLSMPNKKSPGHVWAFECEITFLQIFPHCFIQFDFHTEICNVVGKKFQPGREGEISPPDY